MSNTINIGGLEVSKFYLGSSSDVKIYLGNTKLYPHDTPSPKNYLRFVAKETCTFKFKSHADVSANTLDYSLDSGATWTTLANGVDSPSVSSGDVIMWKSTNPQIRTNAGCGTFSSTGNFDVEGNIMSLLYGDNFENETSLSGKNYVFMNLFSGSSVVSAENMELPASTLSEWCYTNMFNRCSSLTKSPTILSADTLQSSCYFNMFYSCTSLTTTPILPAPTLVTDCYKQMFRNCSNVNQITCLARTGINSNGSTENWVSGVSRSGTFTRYTNQYWVVGNNGRPSGWTLVNYSG